MGLVGAKTWLPPLDTDGSVLGGIPDGDWRYIHMSVFIFCTDAGADQRAADALARADARDAPWILLFRQFCAQH
eukprot:15447257-Alexandrium_andersonii.AAC.1